MPKATRACIPWLPGAAEASGIVRLGRRRLAGVFPAFYIAAPGQRLAGLPNATQKRHFQVRAQAWERRLQGDPLAHTPTCHPAHRGADR